ncbi:MAG: hypothetical protein AB2L14_25310 [Candidatus Xenobiia bacterium LiM19]
MIPHATLIHEVSVTRVTSEIPATTKQPRTKAATESNVVSALRCFIWPISAKEQTTILGKFPTATHKMLWNRTELKSRDKVTWGEKTYVLHQVMDFNGHHCEGILEQTR